MDKNLSTIDREIITERILNFPRKLVFKAWSDPNHLMKWWGPKGFTNTFHEFNFRPGGAWRFIMHGPDGTDYPNESMFVKIVNLEQIVFGHLSGHRFKVIATFTGQADKTKVTFRMLFETAAECEKVRKYAPEKNEENFDRLEAELARMREA